MNKPVAWMAKKECQNGLDDFFEHSEDYPNWQIEEFKESYIPLYTHPVKELTDEEIFSIAIDCTYGGDLHADKFAKAILRKAQEK